MINVKFGLQAISTSGACIVGSTNVECQWLSRKAAETSKMSDFNVFFNLAGRYSSNKHKIWFTGDMY